MGITRYYNWVKPIVGADADTWGQELNGTLQAIDAQVYNNAQAVSGGSVPQLLKSGSVTLNATFLVLDLSTFLGYNRLELKLNKVNPGNSSTGAALQLSTNAGSSWITTGYKWSLATLGAGYSQTNETGASDVTQIKIQDQQSLIHGTIGLCLGGTAMVDASLAGLSAHYAWLAGGSLATSNVNAVKVYSLSGSAVSGTYDLIGYT